MKFNASFSLKARGVKMQDSVTRKVIKRTQKTKLKAVIFTVLFFFIIFLISAILVVSKRSNLCFEARTFYMVYVDKNKNSTLLSNLQNLVKDLGGAAVVFDKNNEYYLTASVYSNKDDAIEIADGLKGSFSSASIIELSCKGVSNKYRNLLKQNQAYFDLFHYIYDFSLNFEQLCYGYVKGDTSEGKFMSSFLAHKLEVEKLIENCALVQNKELSAVCDYANLMIVYFEKVFDKFYQSTSKQSVCFEFFVSFVLCYSSLCDNLQ